MISRMLHTLRKPAATVTTTATTTAAMSTRTGTPHIVVLGGSYAGVSAVQNMLGLLQGRGLRPAPFPLRMPEVLPAVKPRITVLDRRDGFFHTMGSPLALTCREYAEKAWQSYKECASFREGGVGFVHGEAMGIDVRNRVITYESRGAESGEGNKEMPYDYLIVTTGLARSWPAAPGRSTKGDYLADVERYSRELERTEGAIVIVGGGAVGVEMSAEIAHACPSKKVILIHSREELLSSEPVPGKYRERVRQLVDRANVEVQLGKRVDKHETVPSETGASVERLTLRTGEVVEGGKVIFCTARPAPNTQILPADCLDAQGCVKVNSDLSLPSDIPNSGYHFAAGDIAAWNGMKSVGGAMIMGQCAAINVIGHLGAETQQEETIPRFSPVHLPPFPLMMALAVGGEATTLDMDGVIDSGRHIREGFFGNDLALTKTRELLGLSAQEE